MGTTWKRGVPRPSCAPIRGSRSSGWTSLGLVTVAAIVSVVVFVSVPRLRRFALNENETDALATVSLLARQLEQCEPSATPPPIRDLVRTDSLARALSDSEFLGEGVLLRRHGYLFRVVTLSEYAGEPSPPILAAGTVLAAERSPDPRPRARFGIQAWPWRCGETGAAALLGSEDGRLFRHVNGRGHWDGPLGCTDSLSDWAGWVALP